MTLFTSIEVNLEAVKDHIARILREEKATSSKLLLLICATPGWKSRKMNIVTTTSSQYIVKRQTRR